MTGAGTKAETLAFIATLTKRKQAGKARTHSIFPREPAEEYADYIRNQRRIKTRDVARFAPSDFIRIIDDAQTLDYLFSLFGR